MAYKQLIAALGLITASSPVLAAQPDPAAVSGAPTASPDARYCLWIEPVTGSRIETIRCETREAWAELGVDLDKDWPKEGVRVIEPAGLNG